MPNIKLQSSDLDVFEVDVEIIKCSSKLKSLLDADTDLKLEMVCLINVKSEIVRMIIEWATFRKNNIPEQLDMDNWISNIHPWEREFFNVDVKTITEIIVMADELKIEPLLDVTCKIVADMIRGKTYQEICRMFDINENISPVESSVVLEFKELCEAMIPTNEDED